MILDVPYQSQEPLETSQEKKWCGIASLWMVLTYYLKDQAPKVEELLEKYGADFESGGFTHKDLIKIAREFNLKGFRKSWWASPGVEEQIAKFKEEGESDEEIASWLDANIQEGFFTLGQFIQKGIPVIVSVSPEFSPSNSTHLVVVVGDEDNNFILHDPYKRGSNYKITKEEFKKYWIRQAIIIKK